MNVAEAQKIIESLASGQCPVTGQKLGDVYQQPEVIRALFVASKALEKVRRLEQRHQTLPAHAGKPWDAEEDRQLCEEFETGNSLSDMAQHHKRTRGAIQARLERLGKMTVPPPLSISQLERSNP